MRRSRIAWVRLKLRPPYSNHSPTHHSPLTTHYSSFFPWLCALLLLAGAGCNQTDGVVVYCAHDQEFAEQILADFEKQAAFPVVTRFDSEANKSVGLFDDLVREARRPRCDVHWNNEIIATIRLARLGILESYDSPSAKPFPSEFKATDHSWHAFAARARILLINTELLAKRGIPEEQWPKGLEDLTRPRFSGLLAMSKPTAGTSATQAACLFQVWGPARAKEWYRALKANGIQFVGGNKQAAEGVGLGQYAVSMTDTDDASAEVEAGRPVRIVFPDQQPPAGSRLGTLFIPNTVAVIKGCPRPARARQLVDFLLSEAVEKRLAASESRQIPLNPNVQAKLPPSILTPLAAPPLPVDFEKAADYWEEAQAFVRDELLRP
jgi:iron(III) transport system substrate-binding protein